MSLHLQVTPYRLPLRRLWRTARGVLDARAGWLVRAQYEGVAGFGDCAPLPAAGTETAAQAKAQLLRCSSSGCEAVDDLLAALDVEVSDTPAADCALEAALLDRRARALGLSLRRLLCADAVDRIAVNAALGGAAALEPSAVQQALAAGFRVLKLKVGAAPMDIELPRIEAVAALLPPGATLRLDANGAWDASTAALWIERLDGLPIDCIEEPIATADDAMLSDLQAAAPFSLALDESLVGRKHLDARRLPVRRLVLKPGVVGGLRRTLRIAEQARAAGLEVVVTSLVESAAGLWVTAQLAAATGSPLAHGLATADWLSADLGAPPSIEQGWLRLPDTAGSGFLPFDDPSASPSA